MISHSLKLAHDLLQTHFERYQDGPVVRYRPKTERAHEHWNHTGVCPSCLARSISLGSCVQCGWTPDPRGDCYEAAGRLVSDAACAGQAQGYTLVHGVVGGQGALEGRRFGHAWVEIDDGPTIASERSTPTMPSLLPRRGDRHDGPP